MPSAIDSPHGSAHRGWTSRGYLPHFDSPFVIQSVTFRLADSLPQALLDQMTQELRAVPPDRRADASRLCMEEKLNGGHGCCVLAQPDAARCVQTALLHFDGGRYNLLAWVVMPNHVHVLFEPRQGVPLAKIVGSWKSYTGRRLVTLMPNPTVANGDRRAWQPGYWDRYMRDEHHYQITLAYIEQNPVKAGLVARAEDWPWSSLGAGAR